MKNKYNFSGSTLKREHPALQNRNFQIFSTKVAIYALLDPDTDRNPNPDPLTRLNPDLIRIRIFATLISYRIWKHGATVNLSHPDQGL
jgi:hypothetical protein